MRCYVDIKAKEKLVTLYQALSKATPATCLKYYYTYRGANVNLYFDAFDKSSLSFCMILAADQKYYFTPLNILEDEMNREYLADIPTEILSKILVDKKLNDFYTNMENHILQDTPKINYYSTDTFFKRTTSYQKGKIDLPFWQGTKRVRMSEKTLISLSHRADISIDSLRKIQRNNLTLVRTSNPERRRDLTLILNEHNINL